MMASSMTIVKYRDDIAGSDLGVPVRSSGTRSAETGGPLERPPTAVLAYRRRLPRDRPGDALDRPPPKDAVVGPPDAPRDRPLALVSSLERPIRSRLSSEFLASRGGGIASVTEGGEAVGALDQQRASGTGEAVGGDVAGESVAGGGEVAIDERAQAGLESAGADSRVVALEGFCDAGGVAGVAVAFAVGDGLETVALEAGEFDPRAPAVRGFG